MEVGPLSRGMMLLWAQSLSISLQDGLRFFHFPLPTPPSAHLAVCFPCWERYGLTTFCMDTVNGLGLASSPAARHLRQENAQFLNLATYLLVQACQHLWLVVTYDVYQRFTYVDHTVRP